MALHFAALMLLATKSVQVYALAALWAAAYAITHTWPILRVLLKVVGIALLVSEPAVAGFAVL